MSTKLDRLKVAAKAAVDDARELAVKAGDREMTTTERQEFDDALAKGRNLLEQIKQAQADEAIEAEVKSLLGDLGPEEKHSAGSYPGGQLVGRHVKGRDWAAKAAVRIQATAREHSVKALASGTIDVPNVLAPGVVPLPESPTRLIDVLINRQPLAGNQFAYLRQTVRTNNAAPVADFGTKPTSVFTFAEVEDRARVIAHLSEPIPERYFADFAGLIQVLDGEMFRGVLDALEAQVINGAGTGENMTGIFNTSGVTTQTYGTSLLVTARKARTTLFNRGEVPTAWVLNPADAETVDLLADSTGQYLDAATVANRIFGDLPRLVSASIPTGYALLGDFSQTALYVREDIQLAADRSGTNFTKNQVVLRAEGRFGFAVLRPQALLIVDTAA